MKWLLQNNYVNAMTGKFAFALQHSGRAHDMIDFSLMPSQDLPSVPGDQESNLFFYGSTGLLQRALHDEHWSKHAWTSSEGLDQRTWLKHCGENLFNAHTEFVTLGDLQDQSRTHSFFVRPVEDQKSFTGCVIKDNDWTPVYAGKHGQLKSLKPDLLVAVSPVQDIHSEYRCLVYKNELIGISQYREKDVLNIHTDVSHYVKEAASTLATQWQPSNLSIMDVVMKNDDSIKIMEFNSIHSSGLYALPLSLVLDTIEKATLERSIVWQLEA